jgi:hypothetical protein
MSTAAEPRVWRDPAPTALLDMWERADRLSSTRRALALLSTAVGSGEWELLSIGIRDGALLTLRERLFGPDVSAVVPCPQCGERQELSFTVDEVRAPPPATAAELRVSVDGHEVAFRLPTSADLENLTAGIDVDRAAEVLLKACVLTAEPAELSPELVAAVEERMAAADPQAEVTLALCCDACGARWEAPFDIATFLWSEVDAWAWRLLGEVHQLARAYGWSERDVLALSPQRRRIYLEVAAR